jgi:hypothetical protein
MNYETVPSYKCRKRPRAISTGFQNATNMEEFPGVWFSSRSSHVHPQTKKSVTFHNFNYMLGRCLVRVPASWICVIGWPYFVHVLSHANVLRLNWRSELYFIYLCCLLCNTPWRKHYSQHLCVGLCVCVVLPHVPPIPHFIFTMIQIFSVISILCHLITMRDTKTEQCCSKPY